MKALKILGIVAGIVVLLVAAGALYAVSRFDAAHIKAELARIVQEKKQRTLAIDGELKLSFWPSLGVKLSQLRLSEHASAQEFAHVDHARVSVAVMPLLSKRIVVDAIEVDGARATLVRRKDGTLNIDDLIAKDEKAGAPLRLDVASVKLANVALDWHDEQSGRRASLAGLDLASGHVQVDTGAKTFAADKLKLAAKGKVDTDNFELKLETPKLALAPGQSSVGDVTLEAALDGPQRKAKLKLALAGLEAKGDALAAAKLTADVEAKVGAAEVKGKLSSPLAADLGRRSVALQRIDGEFDVADARMPIKHIKLPVAAAVQADLSKPAAAGHFDTRFDESKIALKFDVSRFSPLALGFALDIDRLDVDKYLPAKQGAPAGKGGARSGEADGKLDFSALKHLDLNGTVNIGALQVANVQASNVRLRVKAASGRIDIAPHSANVYEGTLSGALSLDANDNTVTAKENLAGINVNPLLKTLAGKDVLEGRGNVALDVASRGDTVAAMKKGLHGTASLALHDGAIKGINLAKSLRDLKAKFSSRQDAVQPALASEKTDFSELAASFKIANGVAHNDDLALKSPFLRIAGSGDIDIGGGKLDYLAKASVVASTQGQGGKELEHLKGLTVPVRASGPFEQLSYKLEFGGLAEGAVKAKVEEKTQAIKQQVQEKMLKGLFGK